MSIKKKSTKRDPPQGMFLSINHKILQARRITSKHQEESHSAPLEEEHNSIERYPKKVLHQISSDGFIILHSLGFVHKSTNFRVFPKNIQVLSTY
jgi:hypothetical protein